MSAIPHRRGALAHAVHDLHERLGREVPWVREALLERHRGSA